MPTNYDPQPAERIDWTSNTRYVGETVTVTNSAARLASTPTPCNRLFLTNLGSADIDIGPDANCAYDTILAGTRLEIALPNGGGITDLHDWFVLSPSGNQSLLVQYLKL